MAIVALRRFAVAEHHTAGHRIRALNIRVVEALNVARLHLEAEIALHPLHEAHHSALGIEGVGGLLLVGYILGHVLHAYVENLAAVATLRDDELHALKFHVGHKGHDHLAELAAEPSSYLGNGHREYLLAGLFEPLPELEVETLHHRSPVQMHEADESRRVVFLIGEHIDFAGLGRTDHAAGVVAFHSLEFLLHLLRLLEFPFVAETVHIVA